MQRHYLLSCYRYKDSAHVYAGAKLVRAQGVYIIDVELSSTVVCLLLYILNRYAAMYMAFQYKYTPTRMILLSFPYNC